MKFRREAMYSEKTVGIIVPGRNYRSFYKGFLLRLNSILAHICPRSPNIKVQDLDSSSSQEK